MNANLNPQRLRELVYAFQTSRLILTAFELDIFSGIEINGTTSEELANKIKSNIRATDRLMNALCGIGLLEKKEGKFHLTPESSVFLVKSSPEYLAGLGHSLHLWQSWSKLTTSVKEGKPAIIEEINERGDNWLKSFISAMHDRAKRQAPGQIEHIDLTNVNHLLDVGGGSGAFSMAFLRRKATIKATIFDLPNVIPITKEFIVKEGFEGKIDTLTGDYTTDDIGKGYDLIFLSAIVHSNSFETNNDLVKKCSQALNQGGQLIIQDFVMSNDRTIPYSGALFALNMLVATDEGDTFTEDEITEWMRNAGFKDIKKVDVPFGNSQVVGVK